MTGTLGFRSSTAPSPPPSAASMAAAAGNQQWEVSYSRFFNLPGPETPSSPPALKRLHNSKLRFTGTWISAASPAALYLLRHRGASLSVSVRGKIYEEHLVSNLYYSWPQVLCVPECPIRGSRVVMMSFRDSTGQIQKFAVRFSAGVAAEAFINAVKDCLRGRNDTGHAGSDFVCENSAVSEFIASSGLHNSYDEESTYDAPIATVVPEFPALTFGNDETPALTFGNDETLSPPQPSLDSNVESIFSGFPPSFTDMLNSCTADHRKSEQTEKINVSSQGFPPEQSFDDAAQQSVFIEESRLKAQIAKYMSDASFHDMLNKIESVIVELGGDMAL